MTPIKPGEVVPEDDIITVTDKDSGDTDRYQRELFGLWRMKNGKLSNDYIRGAIRIFTLARAAVVFIVALCGALWALNEKVILPQQQRMIEATIASQLASVVRRIEDGEKRFDAHLLAVAEQRSLYPTRVELKEDLAEIKAMIQMVGGRR